MNNIKRISSTKEAAKLLNENGFKAYVINDEDSSWQDVVICAGASQQCCVHIRKYRSLGMHGQRYGWTAN